MGKNTTEMQSAKLRLWKITQQITWLPEGKREKGRERYKGPEGVTETLKGQDPAEIWGDRCRWQSRRDRDPAS